MTLTEDREADGKRSRSGRFSGDRAREAGARGGRARRKLTVADVERELGSLETPADAKRWLRQAYVWAAAQLLSGSAGNACVGACREWLKAHAEQVDAERVKALEGRLHELESELAKRTGLRVL